MIGIMADSHDNLVTVRRAIQIVKDAGCRLLIHAGDFVAPFTARELEKAGCPIKAVLGNCDGEKPGLRNAIAPFGLIQEAPLVFEHDGFKFLILHLDAPVESCAAKQEYDVIIYGHTHKPEVRRYGKTLIVNPGETGGWLTGKSSAALFDPKTGEVRIIVI
jgi:hypothetical protein